MRSSRWILLSVVVAALLPAAPPNAHPQPGAKDHPASPVVQQSVKKTLSRKDLERIHYRKLLAEGDVSPVDFARALEDHLRRFPDSPHRTEIESSIIETAIKERDNRRIILYGEDLLKSRPHSIPLLRAVARALLTHDDPQSAEKALRYARRMEAGIRALAAAKPPSGPARVRMRRQLDENIGIALLYQARAAGNLGHPEQAVELAKKGYQIHPTADGAREIARWLLRSGHEQEAMDRLAEAFIINDPDNTAALQKKDREQLKKLYLKTHDSEAGLGDLILSAYDRTTAALKARHEILRKLDPNLGATKPLEFTLSGPDGGKFAMSTLAGKVVVLDFWATWCGPCRIQQPLYEKVRQAFKGRDDVVFLNINTDENRELVGPFLAKHQWGKPVYFEDGLSRLLQISSIPTTVILNRQGQVASRMSGFLPKRFVAMLTERIKRTLANN